MPPKQIPVESSKSSAQSIEIGKIRTDGGTQARYQLYEEVAAEYAEDIRLGKEYPPIIVFFDGKEYWLADGFHRVEARRMLKEKKVDAEVHLGTQRDAVLYAVGANSTHGLRRTNADKRRAVERLLRDEEWSQWSDREIARRTFVSQPFVSKLRAELADDSANSESMIRTVQRGGTTYEVDTTNIGQNANQEKKSAKRQRSKKQDKQATIEGNVSSSKQVKQGETWKLGKSHYLFCGDSDSSNFQRRLPTEISLLLIFTQSSTQWPKIMPPNVISALSFCSPFIGEIRLDDLRPVVEKILESTTDAGDTVLMFNLPDPSIYILMDNLDCSCYCAETDPQRCTDALTAWSITNKPAKKLSPN
ncbi:streptomycin biosynthesis regulator [Acaryochloris marina]|uniref:streptomycin biosynthesis regulator n=1 Tax=Acaryochloris marina TaxID=155978 RepID=UPI001BAEB487|nr:streptomycin biosynthesis regulator [Acaryochloris marina]QUY45723.1 streptomycin biosynthesis regulator [Acaryochloris marina S15]